MKGVFIALISLKGWGALGTSKQPVSLELTNYYVIRWDPLTNGEAELRKMLTEAFRKGVKRIAVVVKSNDVTYMEKAREVLSEFIAQTIVIWREDEVSSA
ncbi:MAG: hypothetical protein OSP8Acid_05680 [uncultured Acidilobus sp. OSP8]|nr:MAG: hypothetical protein OSP8Acid_05680 [uncultured Acidilobus sp. OSP8]